MDEGTGFFDDLKKKESKHKSDLSLLNQLYDGEGDKTTLAQNNNLLPKLFIYYCKFLDTLTVKTSKLH